MRIREIGLKSLDHQSSTNASVICVPGKGKSPALGTNAKVLSNGAYLLEPPVVVPLEAIRAHSMKILDKDPVRLLVRATS